MMLWSFIVGNHVDRVAAEVQQIQTALNKTADRAEQVVMLENEITAMQEKAVLLDRISPRTRLTAVLGEIASLMREDIMLSKLFFKYEPIENQDKKGTSPSKAVVQVGKIKKDQPAVAPQTHTRLKVILTGIAAQQSDAATLIARLEETPYFENVALVFSKPKTVHDHDVTEFEIQCYVADYKICK